MGFFRRGKPLHEQLAEEANLDIGLTPPREPSAFSGFLHDVANSDAVGIHGVHRQRQWDTVATVQTDLPGSEVHFVALGDGTIVVTEDVPDGALVPLAEAVESTIEAPYRAEAVRRGDGLWAVAAKRIEVRAFPSEQLDEFELVEDEQVILGRRIDGDLFEVAVSRL